MVTERFKLGCRRVEKNAQIDVVQGLWMDMNKKGRQARYELKPFVIQHFQLLLIYSYLLCLQCHIHRNPLLPCPSCTGTLSTQRFSSLPCSYRTRTPIRKPQTIMLCV